MTEAACFDTKKVAVCKKKRQINWKNRKNYLPYYILCFNLNCVVNSQNIFSISQITLK